MLRTCQAFLKLAVEIEYLDQNYEVLPRYPHLAGSGEIDVVEETFEEKLAAERRREDERRARERPKEPPDYYCNFT